MGPKAVICRFTSGFTFAHCDYFRFLSIIIFAFPLDYRISCFRLRFICFRLRFLYIRLRIRNIRLRIRNIRLRLQKQSTSIEILLFVFLSATERHRKPPFCPAFLAISVFFHRRLDHTSSSRFMPILTATTFCFRPHT